MTTTEAPHPQQRANSRLARREITRRISGGVYNDREIKALWRSGEIVIDPYDEKQVQNSSVDVTLGQFFYGTDKGDGREVLNMFDPASRAGYFKPFEAIPHQEMLDKRNQQRQFAGIPLDALVVVLDPQERVLGHTREAIGIVRGGTTQMQAKSTTGRWGLGVCLDAGWGDEGYVDRWTMELVNMNRKHPIVIVVGMPIAQLIFYKMNLSERSYDQGGHYQAQLDVATRFGGGMAPTMIPRTLKYDEIF